MNILHIVQGYTPAIGGTERLIQKVSEKLVENHGDEVTVFTTNAYNCELFWRSDQPELPVGSETINGVTVRRFPVFNKFNELRRLIAGTSYKLGLPGNDWARAYYNGPIIPGIVREIASTQADVISGSSFPLLHMNYMVQAGKKVPTPVILHGGIHTADDFGFNRPMIYKAIKQADAYIANTTFERDYLVNEKGIAPGKITVIGVGVDIELFTSANPNRIRDENGWGDAPVVAFIGQQVPHKGIDLLIQAMPYVWQTFPGVCVLIAGGTTTYSATINQWYDALPSDKKSQVAIINDFPEAEKPDLFTACDMLVFPSGHESFGITFLEAWAAKKPVIGSRIGAIPTVIQENVDGLLIEHHSVDDLVQAIRSLIEKPEWAVQLGETGYEKTAQNYTWNIVAAKFRVVYETQINK
ncbi:MAG: glycosyltransferase family 4 protein [Chloroflexi bacterium]|nr:glycosyltransferase family 4 protein [Chloroflexota bacterium]